MDSSFQGLGAWVEHLVIAQTPDADYRGCIRNSGLPALNLTVA